jgi:Flp pilus assembly pilin Flp
VNIEQYKRGNKGQTLVEYALLLPMVSLFIYMSFLFYQGFVQANLYGRTAQDYNYYSVEENQAFGQEMAVALPFP